MRHKYSLRSSTVEVHNGLGSNARLTRYMAFRVEYEKLQKINNLWSKERSKLVSLTWQTIVSTSKTAAADCIYPGVTLCSFFLISIEKHFLWAIFICTFLKSHFTNFGDIWVLVSQFYYYSIIFPLVPSACESEKYHSSVSTHTLISMDYVGMDAVRNESCQREAKFFLWLSELSAVGACISGWCVTNSSRVVVVLLDSVEAEATAAAAISHLPSHFPWQVWTKDPEKCHCSIFKSLGQHLNTGMNLPLHIMQIILTAYLMLLLG